MTSHATEVITGAVVVAAAAGFFVYASQFADARGAGAGFYEMTASFRSIEGVSVGTDVRLGGVKVGTVTELTLNPDTFRADAVFTVQENLALPDDTAILVSSEGLLGGSFLELLPGGSPFNLEPGSAIQDTQSSVSLITLLMRFVAGDGEGEVQ
jgi:phospholipid/cholesterol/gamma-HCH transport system substrate-binding protein